MTFGSSFWKKRSLYPHTFMYFMGLGRNDPWVESHMWPQQTWGQRSSRGQWPLVQVFEQKGFLYPHTLTYFHGTWIKWSLCRVTHVNSTEVGSKVTLGSLTFWLIFEKLSLYPHSFMYYHGSWTNITMIVKVCDRESRQDLWFDNRLVFSCKKMKLVK